MSAPPGFAGRRLVTQLPASEPPHVLKHQIYTDPSFFKSVDDHVQEVVGVNYKCFLNLMWHLIFHKHFDELERARAIFRWMTLRDNHKYEFTYELTPGSPEELLQGLKNGTTKPAHVFERIATQAGLTCVTVSGWVKGDDYRPGMPVIAEPANHSWNAVRINGDWQLIDSELACSSPDEYDDFYFIPDPKEFIYSHFPEDPKWQLCNPICSQAEFEDYPLVKPEFFRYGMQLMQQNQGEIYTHKGILILPLTLQEYISVTYNFTYGPDDEEIMDGVPLKRYILQETVPYSVYNYHEDSTDDGHGKHTSVTHVNRVNFYVRTPHEGTYHLTIFAFPNKEDQRPGSDFKPVCEYKVICEMPEADIQPFPSCSDCGWGQGPLVEKFGLTLPNQCSDQIATYVFSEKEEKVVITKSHPVRLHMFLKKDGLSESQLESAVSGHNNVDSIYVYFDFPVHGEYMWEIYASELSDGIIDGLQLICQCLVTYTDQDRDTVYGSTLEEGIFRYNYPLDQYEALVEIQRDPYAASPRPGFPYLSQSLDTSDMSSASESPSLQSPVRMVSPLGKVFCPICLEFDRELQKEGKRMMSTTCGHLFCETCIDGIMQHQRRCPTCRATLGIRDIHPIYI